MTNIQPFKINIPEETLSDLKVRLENTRWPDEILESDWNYGANLKYMRDLVEYWKTQFDWRSQEKILNSYNHFKTNIDGLNIHFIYERGKGPNPTPLIITHGWPSSFVEMLKIIRLLTDPAKYGGNPEDSFDVIVPSLPGFGFSDRPTQPGCNVQKIADIWMQLMTKVLGYDRFCAHGGDWGTSITARLGFAYPNHVMGIHTTSVTGGTPSKPYPGTRPLSQAESEVLEARAKWLNSEGAYAHIQSTKPQTHSYGLNDSPVGLAAELVEKYRAWSDCNGDVEKRFSKDDLLTNITLYWVTQTISSSMRIYYEYSHNPWVLGPDERINVPCAVACFPKEMSCPLREWAERFYNIQRWTNFSSGGHFPASEEPRLLAEDLRAFFRDFCKINS